jgi:hypothetical protein
MKKTTHEQINEWLKTIAAALSIAASLVGHPLLEHPRPPVDNPPDHSVKLWTASLTRGAGICPPAPRDRALRA